MPRQMLSQEDYQFICSAAKGLVAENSAMERETQGLLLLQYIGLNYIEGCRLDEVEEHLALLHLVTGLARGSNKVVRGISYMQIKAKLSKLFRVI